MRMLWTTKSLEEFGFIFQNLPLLPKGVGVNNHSQPITGQKIPIERSHQPNRIFKVLTCATCHLDRDQVFEGAEGNVLPGTNHNVKCMFLFIRLSVVDRKATNGGASQVSILDTIQKVVTKAGRF